MAMSNKHFVGGFHPIERDGSIAAIVNKIERRYIVVEEGSYILWRGEGFACYWEEEDVLALRKLPSDPNRADCFTVEVSDEFLADFSRRQHF